MSFHPLTDEELMEEERARWEAWEEERAELERRDEAAWEEWKRMKREMERRDADL